MSFIFRYMGYYGIMTGFKIIFFVLKSFLYHYANMLSRA